MKKIIREEIFIKSFNGDSHDVRYSDLPKDLKESDIIHIHREESYFSENNSCDAFTELIIIREREETDEEFKTRTEREERISQELKSKRFETYLKLKKEFEN